MQPKPIDDGTLVEELINQIKDPGNEHYHASLNFLIYNTLPGTTSAAGVKARFLKEVILNRVVVEGRAKPKLHFRKAEKIDESESKQGPPKDSPADAA